MHSSRQIPSADLYDKQLPLSWTREMTRYGLPIRGLRAIKSRIPAYAKNLAY